MKELSIEEKAKRYDEAIEKLRSLHDNYDTVSTLIDIKEELEQIFPELKESDDDRIRKWIINEIKIKHHNLDEANVDFVDKAIAWLEKQGEKGTNGNEREIPNSVWSEEDEKAVNDIMWIIEAYRKNGFNETHIQIANDSENWLKSLIERYTWKPSESDILLLERIANGKSNPKDFQASLGGLIGRLKELKGE